MLNPRNALSALLVVCALILTLAWPSSGETGRTEADRPEWQGPNTIQNMFENHNAWAEYTGIIDDEILDTNDPQLFANLVGENLSVTAELLQHYNEQAYPIGSCAQDFFYFWTTDLQYWERFYAAHYYNSTSDTGEPIDTAHIAKQYDIFTEFALQEGLDDKCWNKLDT